MFENLNKFSSIKYCKKCLMPSSRPRIRFNNADICNACIFLSKQKKINWANREKEIKKICDKFRSSKKNYDCIVPWSGGKDSSYIAYQLKFKYDMNPLLVTFSPLLPTEVGEKNRRGFLDLGFDNYLLTSNLKASKHLSKRFFFERGNPKVHWDAGIKSLPLSVAIEKKIKLVFYAENGEWHYGGNVLHKDSDKKLYLDEIYENNIGDDPYNWIDDSVTEKEIQPFILPSQNDLNKLDINPYYYAYFFKWDVVNNFLFLKKKFNFETHPNGRTPGTFTNFDSLDDSIDQVYYYMQMIKFGFGRCHRDMSRQIQFGKQKINTAKKIIKKYDQEVPLEDINYFCKYIDISKKVFFEVVDLHRNKEIWTYGKKSGWKLKSSYHD